MEVTRAGLGLCTCVDCFPTRRLTLREHARPWVMTPRPSTLTHWGSTGCPALSQSLGSQARRTGARGRATVGKEGVLPSCLLLPETWNALLDFRGLFPGDLCPLFFKYVSFLASSRKHKWS